MYFRRCISLEIISVRKRRNNRDETQRFECPVPILFIRIEEHIVDVILLYRDGVHMAVSIVNADVPHPGMPVLVADVYRHSEIESMVCW